jgi:hypothetical protein
MAATMGLAVGQPSYAASSVTQVVTKAIADCPFDDSAGQIADTQAFGVPGLSPGQVDVRKTLFQPATRRLVGPVGAGFGTTVAVGFLDADHCPDLVVGEPAASGGGAVAVFTGSTSGIGTTPTSTISAQTGADRFGAAVALGSRYTSGRLGVGPYVTDLWVAAPGRTVDGQTGAGAIDHYVVPQSGSPTLLETITAASAVVGGQAQDGAGFGSVLSANPEGLLVGVPDENVNGRAGAGAAYWLHIDTGSGATDQVQSSVRGSATRPAARRPDFRRSGTTSAPRSRCRLRPSGSGRWSDHRARTCWSRRPIPRSPGSASTPAWCSRTCCRAEC